MVTETKQEARATFANGHTETLIAAPGVDIPPEVIASFMGSCMLVESKPPISVEIIDIPE